MKAPIRVVPYDPEWRTRFEAERTRLRAVFGSDDVFIEHVGSTSVSGLAAKPIIDIALGATSLGVLEARIPDMVADGYQYVPQYESEIPDRRYFRRPVTRPRTVHVHGCVKGGDIWIRHLAFRDWLRTHEDDRDAYAALKTRLADEAGADMERYMEGKNDFIRSVIERALAAAKGAASILVAACAIAAGPHAAEAQTDLGTTVGAVAGIVQTEGLWQPTADSESVLGAMAGGFVEARTPTSWLSLLAEVAFVQRNSNVTGTIEGQPLQGGVRTDYLSIVLGPRFSIGRGPARLHLTVGPGTDQVIRARIDPTLSPVLNEVETVFGVTAIVGIGTVVSERYRVDVEARAYEGLGDAHTGDFLGRRNRSFGLTTRVGIPIPSSLRGGG